MFAFCLFVQVIDNFSTSKNPILRIPWHQFRTIDIEKMWDQLKFKKNMWTGLIFRYKHVELIKLSIFIPQQSIFCIFTATFCLPYQIRILFETWIDILGASLLIYVGACRRFSTLPHKLDNFTWFLSRSIYDLT